MLWERVASADFFGLLMAGLQVPVVNLVIAAGIVALVLVARTGRGAGTNGSAQPQLASRHVAEAWVLGNGAVAAAFAYGLLRILQSFVFDLVNVVSWWYYATPLISGAAIATVVVLVMTVGERDTPLRPMVPTSRRTWASFVRPREITAAALATALLISITVFAGMNSTPDQEGRFVYVNITVPNTDVEPLRPWFYGWAYGVPVLICAALMILAAWGALHINARRSFTGPDLITSERATRTIIGNSVARIVTGAALLSLAGALRFIARGSSIDKLTIEGQGTYEAVWRHAEFAVVGGAVAPCFEIVGFFLLLLTGIAMSKAAARPAPRARTAKAGQAR